MTQERMRSGVRPVDYRPDLQGLRALAVLLVLAAHAGVPGLQGGFVGVDVFFVLSGFVITRLLLAQWLEHGRIGLVDFWARRMRRLLPALALVIGTTLAVGVWLYAPFPMTAFSVSAPYALLYASNIYFAHSARDYFDESSSRDWFLHTWSLGVEEQFYVFWPLFLLALAWGGRRYFLRHKAKGERNLSPLGGGLALIALGSFLLMLYWSQHNAQWAFYMMPARIWQFAAGAFLAVGWFGSAGRLNPGRRTSTGLAMVGMGLIIGAAVFLSPEQAYPDVKAIVPVLGAVLVILAGNKTAGRGGAGLGTPLAVWIGDRSYALYLWHWPVLMLVAGLGWLSAGQAAAVGLLLALALAVLSYRFVEQPLWKGRWARVGSSGFVLVLGATLVMALAAASTGLRWYQQEVLMTQSPPENSRFIRAMTDVPEFYHRDCDRGFDDSQLTPCLIGDNKGQKLAVLFGDSIAAQWEPALRGALDPGQWTLVVLTKSACPIVDEPFYYPRLKRIYNECQEWRDKAVDYIISLRPDMIITGGSLQIYNFTAEQWRGGTRRIIDSLSVTGSRIVYLLGNHELNFHGPECLYRAQVSDKNYDRCARPVDHTRYSLVFSALRDALAYDARVRLIDPNPWICPEDRCAALAPNGTVVFRDQVHLTKTFVQEQSGRLYSAIIKADDVHHTTGISSEGAE